MIPTKQNKQESKKVDSLTIEEIKKVLESSNERDKLIYSIAAFMGLRLTEIVNIEIRDINFVEGSLDYRVAKTNELTMRLIPTSVLKLIKKYIVSNNLWHKKYLFVITHGAFKGQRVSEDTISKRTKSLFIKLSIGRPKKIYNRRSPLNPIKSAIKHSKTFHSFRHFYATQYYDLVENDLLTARSLRHSKGNVETIRKHYIEINRLNQEFNVSNSIVKRVIA